MNRDFPAKRAKYWNIYIIKTTASIITKFCRVIETPQVLTVGGPNMPQRNPRWRTAAILKNRIILISSQPIDQFWQKLACWCDSSLWTPVTNKISRFQKSKMVAAAIENSQNHISAKERQILMKFGIMMRLDRPDTVSQKNFVNLTIQDGGGGRFENSKKCNVSTTRRPILMTFSMMMSLGLPDTVCQWNFTNLKIQDGITRHFENWKIFISSQPIDQLC